MSQTLAILGGTPVRIRPFASWPQFGPEEERRLARVLHSGKWGKLEGDETALFERRFADYHGARHGIAVVNGTVSLKIALLASGIGSGDEVIVPPYTFIATASAVLEANAVPVFADIDPATFNIDPAAMEAAITARTRAIIPVHMGGLPADMDTILAIAGRRGLTVIEDAAHAHGAELRGRRAGSMGHLGSFSFQSTKNLTCGEGGIVITSDDGLAERCRSFHNCGRIPGGAWYEHHLPGGNYRLGEFQAAVLNAQMDRFEEQAAVRERNGLHLSARLRGIPGVLPQERTADCTRHGWHLFLFRIDPEAFGAPRDAVLEALRAEGIPVSAGYPIPIYRQPLFTQRAFGPFTGGATAGSVRDYGAVRCPHCEAICTSQGAWMEQRLLLGTTEDMEDIACAFTKARERREALLRWWRGRKEPGT